MLSGLCKNNTGLYTCITSAPIVLSHYFRVTPLLELKGHFNENCLDPAFEYIVHKLDPCLCPILRIQKKHNSLYGKKVQLGKLRRYREAVSTRSSDLKATRNNILGKKFNLLFQTLSPLPNRDFMT